MGDSLRTPDFERSALVNLRQRAGEPLRGVVVVAVVSGVVKVVMMVLRRGKSRGSNHHEEKGGEQNFLHGSNRSIALAAETYNLC
jgi:hypothetical protein